MLTGFWLTISDYATPNPNNVKLNMFGSATGVCSSVGLGEEEYITTIGTHYN